MRSLLEASEKDFPTLEKGHTLLPWGTVRIVCPIGSCSAFLGPWVGQTLYHAGMLEMAGGITEPALGLP